MKKVVLVVVFLCSVAFISAQKYQRVGYIDMEYILENVPEYLVAQNTLDAKVVKWKGKLDKQARHIEVLKTDLTNEKAILTKDLIEEKEEEITLKQEELRRLESLYFGPKGDMFSIRKQLVKPIQDKVYNAIQNIAARKKYDFIFDKSSDLVMLYSNKKYDISDLVLSTINRTRKIEEKNAKKKAKKAKKASKTNAPKGKLTEQQKEVLARKNAIADKKATQNAAKKKARQEKQEALKAKIAASKKAKLAKREAARKKLRERKEALRKKKEEQKQNNNN